MIKNILFDLDGTIINSEEGIINCLIYTLEAVGRKKPLMEDMRKCIGPPLTESFLNVFHVTENQLDEVMKIYRKRYSQQGMYECELYSGIEDAIKALKMDGYCTSVASSKNEKACRGILEHFQMTDIFDDIVGSSEDRKVETKAEVLQEVFLRNPDWKKSETILVGDTHFDVEGASAAGINCLGVTYGFGTKDELLMANAVSTVDTPEEVRTYIESIQNK